MDSGSWIKPLSYYIQEKPSIAEDTYHMTSVILMAAALGCNVYDFSGRFLCN